MDTYCLTINFKKTMIISNQKWYIPYGHNSMVEHWPIMWAMIDYLVAVLFMKLINTLINLLHKF